MAHSHRPAHRRILITLAVIAACIGVVTFATYAALYKQSLIDEAANRNLGIQQRAER